MSDVSPPEDFSALRRAEALSAEHLEYLTEFCDEISPQLRLLSRGAPTTTLEQAIEIVAAAPAALDKKKKKRKLSAADKKWHAELANEFPESQDKRGDRLPAVLSHGEIRELLEASKVDKRDHLLFRVFYASGVRISELEKLLVADLYLPELKIFVRDGKGDKDRYALIDPETARLLGRFVEGLGPKEKVFEIGSRQISRVIQGYADDLGISERYTAIGRNFTPHSLRHTFATHLYEGGMDLFILQILLGHAFLDTTREYIAIGINRQRKIYSAMHPLCQPDDENDGDRE